MPSLRVRNFVSNHGVSSPSWTDDHIGPGPCNIKLFFGSSAKFGGQSTKNCPLLFFGGKMFPKNVRLSAIRYPPSGNLPSDVL